MKTAASKKRSRRKKETKEERNWKNPDFIALTYNLIKFARIYDFHGLFTNTKVSFD